MGCQKHAKFGHVISSDSSRVQPNKSGELWSTIHKVVHLSLDPPKSTYSTDYISAPTGCWLMKFLHALEFEQTLVAHIAIGVGGPLKNFKGQHVKSGLKFYICASITLGVVGITSRIFTSGCGPYRGDQVDTNFIRGAPTNFWMVKNVENSSRFLTTFEFDRKYLSNGSTYRKSEKYLINYISSPIGRKKIW